VGGAGCTWGVGGYIYKSHTFLPNIGINQLAAYSSNFISFTDIKNPTV